MERGCSRLRRDESRTRSSLQLVHLRKSSDIDVGGLGLRVSSP